MQCGVASLAMVSQCLGCPITLEFLERFCSPTNQGVSMKGIADAAEKIGLEASTFKMSINALSRLKLPAILHWNQNHFVVLYKVSKSCKKFKIADPGKGKFSCNREFIEKKWVSTTKKDNSKAGIAMTFRTTQRFKELTEAQPDEKKYSLKFILNYLNRFRRHFILIIFGLILGCLLQLILPFLTQEIVDSGIKHENIKLIWLILIGELLIVIGQTVTDLFRRWVLLHLSMRINLKLVSDFFIKLLKLPMSFFDTKLMGDLLQRISDHSRVQSFLTGQALNIIFSTLSFIILGAVLLVYNKMIFGVFMLGSIVYGTWIAIFLKRRKVLDYELFEHQAINQNKTYQFLTAMQEIKLQDCERRRRWEWEETQADLFAVQMKSLKLQQAQQAGSIFINEIKNILITVVAATSVIDGKITLGTMLAVQYIVGQLNAPVEQFMSFIYSLQDVKISMERINEIHNGQNEDSTGKQAKSFADGKGISMRNISFRYDRHTLKPTLKDINLEIPEGKVTAIVGASGSGKTTLIKLLLGYYQVENGEIEIVGRKINDYNMKWWRQQCGVVMQDGVIFSESIERNIAVDDNEVDKDRLRMAAKMACIDDFIMNLPLGYNTRIGRDGHGLSQGQKQRILIARAIYRQPAFIFLDEATNSLDAENERVIVENLKTFYQGRTVLVVAHRLSTVSHADNIVVLEKGSIIEQGNHKNLIEKKGLYYHLVKNQLELGN